LTTISEIYSPSAKSRIFENDVAKINDGIATVTTKEVWDRRNDLDGTRLVLTVVPAPPQTLVPHNDPKKTVGIGASVMHDLSKKFNFTYEFILPKRGTYGVMDENGTWDGMMGQVLSGEADITLVMSATKERMEVLKFFKIVATSTQAIFTKKPDQYSRFSFIQMLDLTVWIYGCAFMLASMVCVGIIGYLGSRDSDRGSLGHLGYGVFTIFRCLVDQVIHTLVNAPVAEISLVGAKAVKRH
jgi:hypothetical protein